MARSGGTSGDWLLLEELFVRGEPGFVDALRAFDDAETLGAFAPRWIADPRPEARGLLFDYLDRPLNAFRHEALVKRLFKRAEAARDDTLLARFLVLFDRSVRREQGRRVYREIRECKDEAQANALAFAWRNQGYRSVNVWRGLGQRYQVWGDRVEPVVSMPRATTMPRGALRDAYDPYLWDPKTRRYRTFRVPDWVFALKLSPRDYREGQPLPQALRKGLERRRLFSLATRQYLRRRAWRYFRHLGRRSPERYVAAVSLALVRYRDDDAADGLELIDNWGLVHILFHHSPVLVANERGWRVAEGHSLSELEPAPMFAALWKTAPRALVDLLVRAQCRAVRAWAVQMIRRDLAAVARVFPLEERLSLLEDDDPEVVGLIAEMVGDDPGLAEITPERWLSLARSASPAALEVLGPLMERWISPGRIAYGDAVALAVARPLPLARLGLALLRAKSPREEAEYALLLGLDEAECEPLRPELVAWARGVLSASPHFQTGWVLRWLDSRHIDIRAEAWEWFRDEPRASDDVELWQRLMETPYDDVRLALVAHLEARERDAQEHAPRVGQGNLDPERLRLLWASVLLNVRRGNRAKPRVVGQLLRRAESHPEDVPRLLPLLAVALRSVRGPEWRAGLTAVVRLAGRDQASAELVQRAFPELQLG